MDVVLLLTWLGACIALFVAAFEWPFGSVARYRGERWRSLIAGGSGVFVAATAIEMGAYSPGVILGFQRAQIAGAALVVYGWLRYASVAEGRPPGRAARWLERSMLVVCLLSLTGALQTGRVVPAAWVPFGNRFTICATTPLGSLCYLVLIAGSFAACSRQFRARREDGRFTRPHGAALVLIGLFGLNDALATVGVKTIPYLLTIGIVGEVVALGIVASRRRAADARRADELSASLEKQVEARTAELRSAEEALRRSERLAAIGRLAAGVAHEINNPAAVVASNLGWLRDQQAAGKLASDEAREALTDSLDAVARISRIVRALLASGRAAAGTNSQPFLLEPVMRSAARRAQETAQRPLAQVEVEPAPGLVAIGDPQVLEQVLTNLVVNGLHAIPPDRAGRVAASAERAGDRVLIQITDDGAGIPDEVRAHLFEPFFSTKPFGEGTGLGLSMSLGLVQGMGGELTYQTSVGVGTTMTVSLRAAGVAELPASAPASEPSCAKSAPCKVLLVDDEPRVLEALRKSLSSHFDVHTAAGVEAAWAELRHGRFDLLLCDVMMPAGGAPELIRRLDEAGSATSQRTIFLTGGATSREASEFLAAQQKPVLHKPFDVPALLDAARRLQ